MTKDTAYTKCPKCEAKYSYINKAAEKNPQATEWSDGFINDHTKTDLLAFSKCPKCNTLFWLKENNIEEGSEDIQTIKNIFEIEKTGANEINLIKEAIKEGLGTTKKKEIYLRTKLWHSINHVMRHHETLGVFEKFKQKLFKSSDYKSALNLYNESYSTKQNNLIRLANLLKLDKKESQNHLKFAEIYRELGDFSKSLMFIHKTETSITNDAKRVNLLKQHIKSKTKTAYML